MNQPVDFLYIAVILISIGIYGLVVKRNALRLIFSIELIANAVNLALTHFRECYLVLRAKSLCFSQ